MNYKLVALDCDGTLVDSSAHIPEENIRIIHKLRDMGIKFIVATGRNDYLVHDYVNELGIDSPVIGCNGASIRHMDTKVLVKEHPISIESLQFVLKYCDENDINIKVYTLHSGYMHGDGEVKNVLREFSSSYSKVLSVDVSVINVGHISKFADIENILKIVIVELDDEKLAKIKDDLKQIKGVEVVTSSPNCVDIMCEGVSKGHALAEYATSLGIKKEEIVAIGDSENDKDMLLYSGCSVAMANGEDEIKEMADFITESNNNSGVAVALKKIFNIE